MRTISSRSRLTMGVGIALVLMALVLGIAGVALAFSDVPADHPYAAAIADLSARHIVNGVDANNFKPNDPVTRQQFAKMIVLTMALPVSAGDTCAFTDVDKGLSQTDALYPYNYVAVCANNAITTGKTPTTFDPTANITRAQLMTMVARAAKLPDPPASYQPLFPNFSDVHFPWARKAAYAGLLDGLVGMEPASAATYDFSKNATRGECAQLLSNLLKAQAPDTSLPAFADLQPAGPVGFTFTINTPQIYAAEHLWTDNSVWPATLTASTITGHVSVQRMAVANGQVTIKLTLDSLRVPENQFFSQTDVDPSLPAYLLLRVDDQGTVLGISYASKGKPEQALDQTMVAGLATFLTPVTSALMLPYSGQLAKPGDHLDVPKSYAMLGKKIMDVDTQFNYLTFNAGIANLGFNVAATNIDIPLRFDMKPFLPLLGYDVPPGNDQLMLDLSVGTSVLSNGDYALDTTSGLPTGMTLSSTMMLDAYIHSVPPQLLYIWPNSDFARGEIDHAYLRGADKTSPITITLSLTKDAAH